MNNDYNYYRDQVRSLKAQNMEIVESVIGRPLKYINSNRDPIEESWRMVGDNMRNAILQVRKDLNQIS